MQQYPTDPQPSGPVPAWTIDRIEDAPIVGGPNISARGKRVWFHTALDHSSFIEVPLSEFTPENVARLIDRDVAALYSVAALQGPPLPQ